MRCPTCEIECRTDSGTNVLKFICRSKQCPDYGHVMGEKPLNEPVVRVNYPVQDN